MPNKFNAWKENVILIVITMIFVLGFITLINNDSITGYGTLEQNISLNESQSNYTDNQTEYKIAANPFNCTNITNTSITMVEDIECNGTNGVVVYGQNITFDCAGFTISSNQTAGTIGINVTGNNITIKNCNVKGFAQGIVLGKTYAAANYDYNNTIFNTAVYETCKDSINTETPSCFAIKINTERANLTDIKIWDVSHGIFTYTANYLYSWLKNIDIQNFTKLGISFVSYNQTLGDAVLITNATGTTYGIYMSGAADTYIYNASITNVSYGYYKTNAGTTNLACLDCKAYYTDYGFYLPYQQPINITNPIVMYGRTAGGTTYDGMTIGPGDSAYITYITNATIYKVNGRGIYWREVLFGAGTVRINGCNISDNANAGIYAPGAWAVPTPTIYIDNCNILNNTEGIDVRSFVKSFVTDTNITNSRGYGINIQGSYSGNYENIIITNSSRYGIHLVAYDAAWGPINNNFTNIKIYNHSTTGIYLNGTYKSVDMSGHRFKNITSSGNAYGFFANATSNINITNFTSYDSYGIMLASTNKTTIINSTFNDSIRGITIYSSVNNTIYNNKFNCTINAYDDSALGNIWNTTLNCSIGPNIIGLHCIGGNYWGGSNGYTGTDTNGDYIGDTLLPYNSSNNITIGGDYLPLVYPVTAEEHVDEGIIENPSPPPAPQPPAPPPQPPAPPAPQPEQEIPREIENMNLDPGFRNILKNILSAIIYDNRTRKISFEVLNKTLLVMIENETRIDINLSEKKIPIIIQLSTARGTRPEIPLYQELFLALFILLLILFGYLITKYFKFKPIPKLQKEKIRILPGIEIVSIYEVNKAIVEINKLYNLINLDITKHDMESAYRHYERLLSLYKILVLKLSKEDQVKLYALVNKVYESLTTTIKIYNLKKQLNKK